MSMVPLTHDDLATIAKYLREWDRLLTYDGCAYRPRAELVTRIEVIRPNSGDDVIGHFVLYDGWLGFVPIGQEVDS